MFDYRCLSLVGSFLAALQGCMHSETEIEPARLSASRTFASEPFTSSPESIGSRATADDKPVMIEKSLAPLGDQKGSQVVAANQQPALRELPPANEQPLGRERSHSVTPQDRAAIKLVNSANQYARRKQWNLAQTNIERAYRIAPQNPAVTRTKAEILVAQKRYEEAESWALRTVALLRQSSNSREELTKSWQIIFKCRVALGQSVKSREEAKLMIKRLKGNSKKI